MLPPLIFKLFGSPRPQSSYPHVSQVTHFQSPSDASSVAPIEKIPLAIFQVRCYELIDYPIFLLACNCHQIPPLEHSHQALPRAMKSYQKRQNTRMSSVQKSMKE